jgi:hypothetical protein
MTLEDRMRAGLLLEFDFIRAREDAEIRNLIALLTAPPMDPRAEAVACAHWLEDTIIIREPASVVFYWLHGKLERKFYA